MQYNSLNPVCILLPEWAARSVLLFQLCHYLRVMASAHRSDQLLYRIGWKQIRQTKGQN